MALYILFVVGLVLAALVFAHIKSPSSKEDPWAPATFCVAMAFGLGAIFVTIGSGTTYNDVAKAEALVRGQQEVIDVYTARRDRLMATLERLNASQVPMTMNADSPVRTLIEQIADSESKVAEAETARANARILIDAKTHGGFAPIARLALRDD